jgi:hypothetical protein
MLKQDAKLLVHGKAFALYAQVALFDPADWESYPVWEAGAEGAFFSPGGVVVAAMPDAHVDVEVYAWSAPTCQSAIASGTIRVGHDGLLVGNVVAATTFRVPWPAGHSRVDVYITPDDSHPARVTFVLTALGDPRQGTSALPGRTWVQTATRKIRSILKR